VIIVDLEGWNLGHLTMRHLRYVRAFVARYLCVFVCLPSVLGEFEIFVGMFFVYRERESARARERETPTLLHSMFAVVKSEHSFQVCMYVYICVC
jgi:hypothetical protein